MKQRFRGEKAVPDHLRCRRTDGRGWRCPRRAIGGYKFCEHHHHQLRRNHLNHLAAVAAAAAAAKANRKPRHPPPPRPPGPPSDHRLSQPDADRLPRKRRRNHLKQLASDATGATKIKRKSRPAALPRPPEPLPDRRPKKRRRRKAGAPPVEDLIGVALRRQMERREERERRREAEVVAEAEVRRDLPNGVMAISSSGPPRDFDNAAPPVDRKLGFDGGCFLRRCLRSKNAEALPVGPCKMLPYSRGLGRGGRRNCHRCGENKVLHLLQCSSCWKVLCTSCIKKWYSEMSELEVKAACPICRGCCNCKTCMQFGTDDGEVKEFGNNQNKFGKIGYAYYFICQLRPVLKQINAEQIFELEIEACNQGRRLSGVQLQVSEYSRDKLLDCKYCRVSIVDFHRSCSECSYKLCLRCCKGIRGRCFPEEVPVVTYRYPNKGETYNRVGKRLNGMKQRLSPRLHPDHPFSSTSPFLPPQDAVNNDDSRISCPLKEHGGCGHGTLDLIFILPLGWTEKLDINAA